MNNLELVNVSKIYGQGAAEVRAVRDVTLSLESGKLYLLMGPSGSGKTTLLMMMGCLLKPSSGNIRIFDHDVTALQENRLPEVRRRYIGFIFQSFNLFPALTARENVEATLNLKRVKGEAARSEAARLLTLVGLKDRFNHIPEDLSGGEKQRVAIARALASDPQIILADEPTASLDTRTGLSVVQILRDLAHEGKTVFVVSHDVRLTALADTILNMEDGKIRANGR